MPDGHFWTSSKTGELLPQPPWVREGIAFEILPQGTVANNAIALYRFYRADQSVHFWTTQANGELFGGQLESVVGMVLAQQEPHTVPVYRFSNPASLEHFYTVTHAEAANLGGWRDEGVAFHAYPQTIAMDTVFQTALASSNIKTQAIYRFYNVPAKTYDWCIMLIGNGAIVFPKTVTTSTNTKPDGSAVELLLEYNNASMGLPADSYQINAGACP